MLSRFKRNTNFNGSPYLGIGYIITPKDENIDRDAFVDSCCKNSTALLLTREGSQYENVPVSKLVFNDITFPLKAGELGSQVVFGFLNDSNWPVIIGIIPSGDNLSSHIENTFTFSKTKGGDSVDISGNVDTGSLSIKVSKDKGGRINLSIDGDETSEVFLHSTGRVNISSKEITATIRENLSLRFKEIGKAAITSISYKKGEGFSYEDEFKNKLSLNGSNIELQGKIYNISNKDSYSVKSLLNEIITEISAITVTTSLGTMPIMNKVKVEQLKEKVNSLFE